MPLEDIAILLLQEHKNGYELLHFLFIDLKISILISEYSEINRDYIVVSFQNKRQLFYLIVVALEHYKFFSGSS